MRITVEETMMNLAIHPVLKVNRKYRLYVTCDNGALAPQGDYKTKREAFAARDRWILDSDHYRLIREIRSDIY